MNFKLFLRSFTYLIIVILILLYYKLYLLYVELNNFFVQYIWLIIIEK